jgi:hypothetical protein
MQTHHTVIVSCMIFLAGLFLITSVSAAPGIQASLGEIIPLSGYSYGSQTVYLFLTGPNLPVNGVALNDISKRADEGGFTRVQVDSDDHWSYKWGTANIGGRLDEGTYTIWVVNGPNDRSRLSEAEYRTISVTLGKPSITVDTPVLPGSMDLRSVPDGASVMMAEQYRGTTPLTIPDILPGTYDVVFSRFGYQKLSTRVPVEAGRFTEVTVTLVPDTGSLAITSVPAGARVMVDGENTGIAPLVAGNLTGRNHTITVSLDGYTSVPLNVMVIPGQTVPVTIRLTPMLPQKTETARAAGPSPVIMVAGLVAVLFLIRNVYRY